MLGRTGLERYEEFIKSLQENADRRVKVSPLAAIS